MALWVCATCGEVHSKGGVEGDEKEETRTRVS